jgi:hypothetical protein
VVHASAANQPDDVTVLVGYDAPAIHPFLIHPPGAVEWLNERRSAATIEGTTRPTRG